MHVYVYMYIYIAISTLINKQRFGMMVDLFRRCRLCPCVCTGHCSVNARSKSDALNVLPSEYKIRRNGRELIANPIRNHNYDYC